MTAVAASARCASRIVGSPTSDRPCAHRRCISRERWERSSSTTSTRKARTGEPPPLVTSSLDAPVATETTAANALSLTSLPSYVSFDAPKRWKKELDEHVGVAGKAATGEGVPTVLLANKCDMLGDRAIPTEALDKVAKESGFFRWFETSAKTGACVCVSLLTAPRGRFTTVLLQRGVHFGHGAGHNVDAAITALVEQVMHNQGVTAAAGDSYKVVKLGEGGATDSGGGGCC